MTTPATRLITLIMLLQRQPNQKAAELAEKLDVSVRTLHRYIEMLDEMGIPVYTERGPHGGFSLVRGYKMPPLVFTPEEAVAVYLGASLVGEVWGQLYQESAQGALAKLDNVLPEEQLQEINWARRSLAATEMHRSNLKSLAPLLEDIRHAVREKRCIEMRYRSGSSPHPTQRQVDPYALIHRWGWWYMVGHCHLRKEVRSFRVDRIEKLALLEQVFQVDERFDIQIYLERDWKAPPQLQIRMRFLPQTAHVALYNRAYWDSVQELPDGSVEVVFSAPDKNWAVSNVLAYGPAVEVIEPQEIRELVAEWAQATLSHYEK